MIQAMTNPFERAVRQSSASGPPRPKGLTELSEEELVIEILRLREENKMLQAIVDLSRRWLEEFADHTEGCRSRIGLRCDCGLGIFLG